MNPTEKPARKKCPVGCTCGRHKPATQAHREAARQVGYRNRGKSKSPEHRAKMIKNLKSGVPCEPGCKCPKHSEVQRERMRAIAKLNTGKKRPPEHTPGRKCEPGCMCKRHSSVHYCKPGCTCGRHDEDSRARNGAKHKGKKASPETKKKMTQAQLDRWSKLDQKARSAISAKINKSRVKANDPSKFELAVREVLDGLGVKWLSDQKINGFFPDLVLPDHNLIIEANGCYWHACTACFPDHREADRMHKRDRMKRGVYRKAGYVLEVIVEHEFTVDPRASVLNALMEVMPR